MIGWWDEYSEWSDSYLYDVEYDENKIKSLDELIKNWFIENAQQPTFYQAGKVVDKIIIDDKLLKEYL